MRSHARSAMRYRLNKNILLICFQLYILCILPSPFPHPPCFPLIKKVFPFHLTWVRTAHVVDNDQDWIAIVVFHFVDNDSSGLVSFYSFFILCGFLWISFFFSLELILGGYSSL